MSIEVVADLITRLEARGVSCVITGWDVYDFTNIRHLDQVPPMNTSVIGDGRTMIEGKRQIAFDQLAVVLNEMGAQVGYPNLIRNSLGRPKATDVRLWRVERQRTMTHDVDQLNLDWNFLSESRGNWFTNSVDVALQYSMAPLTATSGRLLYLDIDRQVVEEARRNILPEAVALARPEALIDEVFLASEYARLAQPAPDSVLSTSLLNGQDPTTNGVFQSGADVLAVTVGSVRPLRMVASYVEGPFVRKPVAINEEWIGQSIGPERNYVGICLRIPVNEGQWAQIQFGVDPLDPDFLIRSQTKLRKFKVLNDVSTGAGMLSDKGVKLAVIGNWAALYRGDYQPGIDLSRALIVLEPDNVNVSLAADIFARLNKGSGRVMYTLLHRPDGINIPTPDVELNFSVASEHQWVEIERTAIHTDAKSFSGYINLGLGELGLRR